jgi:hypothetical protein
MAKYFDFDKTQVSVTAYSHNNRKAIVHDDFPPIVLTINLPDVPLAEDEVAIKNYSEHEGVLDDLIDAGIVSQPVKFIQSGFVEIPVCKILEF